MPLSDRERIMALFSSDTGAAKPQQKLSDRERIMNLYSDQSEIRQPPPEQPEEIRADRGYQDRGQSQFGETLPPADMGTHYKAGYVDDVNTKIQIYAKDRGMDPSRYGVDEQGEIFFIGADGFAHFETGQDTVGKASEFIGETAAHAPEIIGGTVGAITHGVVGAGIGSAIGSQVRQQIGSSLFKEDIPVGDRIKDASVAAVTGAAGEGIAKIGMKGVDKLRAPKAGRLESVSKNRIKIDRKETAKMQARGKKFGIHLGVVEATPGEELVGIHNYLGSMPETAAKIGGQKRVRIKEVEKAIGDFIEKIGQTDSMDVGDKAVDALKGHTEKLKSVRQSKALPLYTEALKEKGLDISDTMAQLDEAISKTPPYGGSKARKSLGKVKALLTKEKGDIDIPHDDLLLIDQAKKEINATWKNDPKNAPDKIAQGKINKILNGMLKKIDEKVPAYGKARKIYSDPDDVLNELTGKQRKLGKVQKLGGDDVEKAPKMILDNHPIIVKKARMAIVSHSGQKAWDDLIAARLMEKFDSIKRLTRSGGAKNIGGIFSEITVGDSIFMRRMDAANPIVAKNLKEFSVVLQRTTRILGKESTTEAQGQIGKRLREISEIPVISKVWGVAVKPLKTKDKLLYDEIHEKLFQESNIKIAEAMTSPKTNIQIQRLLKLQPGSQKLIEGVSTFLTLAGKGAFDQKYAKRSRRPVIPEIRQGKP